MRILGLRENNAFFSAYGKLWSTLAVPMDLAVAEETLTLLANIVSVDHTPMCCGFVMLQKHQSF